MTHGNLVRETNKYEVWEYEYSSGRKFTSKLTKYLCIGGPLDGQYKSTASANPKEYFGFNAAGASPNRHVLIHKSILNANY